MDWHARCSLISIRGAPRLEHSNLLPTCHRPCICLVTDLLELPRRVDRLEVANAGGCGGMGIDAARPVVESAAGSQTALPADPCPSLDPKEPITPTWR